MKVKENETSQKNFALERNEFEFYYQKRNDQTDIVRALFENSEDESFLKPRLRSRTSEAYESHASHRPIKKRKRKKKKRVRKKLTLCPTNLVEEQIVLKHAYVLRF